jgi:hypothetical protein
MVIPKSITSLSDYCFSGCSLYSIAFHDKMTTLGSHCFSYCNKLSSIVLPCSIKEVGDYCFSDCFSLISSTKLNPSLDLNQTIFSNSPIQDKSMLLFFEEMSDGKSPFCGSSCPICKEDFSPELKPFVLVKCKHVFCIDCISALYSSAKKCALCNCGFY